MVTGYKIFWHLALLRKGDGRRSVAAGDTVPVSVYWFSSKLKISAARDDEDSRLKALLPEKALHQ